MQIYSEKFEAREPIRLKYRFRRRNGEYRWLLDHGVPLHGPDGTFAGYIGSCIDITELEQARETLERHREDLERLVDERTAKLRETNELLRLSERMASLGTLAAGIGHDLGNLLLPMRIRMDMIEQHLPESQRDSVRVIRTSAEYLANLAKGLRYLSMDTDRAESAGASTDLYVWWEEAMPLLHNSLPKNVTLEREFAEHLPEIAVSPSALTQAIFNLVQNSGTALRESTVVAQAARCTSSDDSGGR
jgi:signal transduction histidine kinase